MTQTICMSDLYNKLSQLGLSQTYIRENALPSWWDTELNNKPVAVLEGAGYIADHLNLDLKSLLVAEEKIRFNPLPPTKFKQHNSTNNEHPHVAQALASRVAELISYGTEIDFTPLPTDVKEIRTEILTTHAIVNLMSLLEYSWSKGIAVCYFHHFPDGIKKFAGLIQWQSTCPVIILSSKPTYPAMLAFNLAHELGHLALGHLKEGVLIDEEIKFDCQDNDEEQANQFATHLLLGDCDNCLEDKPFHNHNHLIKHAKIKAEENPSVEADSIILNNAWYNRKNWGFAIKALKKLGFSEDGQQTINEYLANKLDWDKFNDESYEYLEKVLGV